MLNKKSEKESHGRSTRHFGKGIFGKGRTLNVIMMHPFIKSSLAVTSSSPFSPSCQIQGTSIKIPSSTPTLTLRTVLI
jgi:hypothetical protein